MTRNHERLEARLARLRVHGLDLTGSISAAMSQVREPAPMLKAAVKSISSGSGLQLQSRMESAGLVALSARSETQS